VLLAGCWPLLPPSLLSWATVVAIQVVHHWQCIIALVHELSLTSCLCLCFSQCSTTVAESQMPYEARAALLLPRILGRPGHMGGCHGSAVMLPDGVITSPHSIYFMSNLLIVSTVSLPIDKAFWAKLMQLFVSVCRCAM